MTMRATGALIVATALVLGGCHRQEAQAAHSINDAMTQVMEPTAQTIWDAMSKAYNDRGDALDPAKLDEADWQAIADASTRMMARARDMADHAHGLTVAAANEPVLGSQAAGAPSPAGPQWAAVGPRQIQARVDAQPDLFAQKARVLADTADQLHRAALSRNSRALYEHGSQLDEVCDSCHEPFWGTDEPPPFPKM